MESLPIGAASQSPPKESAHALQTALHLCVAHASACLLGIRHRMQSTHSARSIPTDSLPLFHESREELLQSLKHSMDSVLTILQWRDKWRWNTWDDGIPRIPYDAFYLSLRVALDGSLDENPSNLPSPRRE